MRGVTGRSRGVPDRGRDLAPADLLVAQACLRAGASPAEALAEVRAPALRPVRQAIAAGIDLRTLAVGAGTALPPAASALVRALAVAQAVGAPSGPVVDAVLEQVRAGIRLQQLIRTRSAQAVASARFLVGLPVLGGLGLAALDPVARAFLRGPIGIAVVLLASVLIGVAASWMRWLLRRIPQAASQTDPLVAATWWRRDGGDAIRPGAPGGLPTAEGLDLLALALQGGAGMAEAARLLADLGPAPLRPTADGIGRRLSRGLPAPQALPPRLGELATLIDVSARWGAPTAEPLRLLAGDLRDRAAAAAEAAAERLTVQLVLPTTLLLVPAFGLLVVTPLVASSFSGLELLPQP